MGGFWNKIKMSFVNQCLKTISNVRFLDEFSIITSSYALDNIGIDVICKIGHNKNNNI